MKKCPACPRAGDDIGTCGSFATCPNQAIEVQPTDIVLVCDLCEITRAVPAGRIIQGKASGTEHVCPVEECQCRPVVLSAQDVEKPARGKKQG